MEIYNHRYWIQETDPAKLKLQCEKMLKEAGYTVLNFIEHHFEPTGFTCVWLLAESHLALHTFPENDKTYLELSGCQKQLNQKFVEQLNKTFIIKASHQNPE